MAGIVGRVGDLGALFSCVGVFLVTVLAALSLHALLYYPLSAWLIGGKSPRVYFREGAGAVLTGFSINSSLATAPLTLIALGRMQVSESSARLSACVGTNFNNDGITLYEAITALFIAQAAGMELHVTQQISILLAALAGSMGIAGIPNSGLIILTLVLKAARLPDDTINSGAADRLQHRFRQRPPSFGRQRDGRHAGCDSARCRNRGRPFSHST